MGAVIGTKLDRDGTVENRETAGRGLFTPLVESVILGEANRLKSSGKDILVVLWEPEL